VSLTGQLGVVSGTALAAVLARRLQDGDPEGDVRRALSHFPDADVASRLLKQYFVEGGKPAQAPYRGVPMPTLDPSQAFLELTVAGNFVEVFLAKEGHSGVVGINLLEKVQLCTLPSIYGAMLAGVDFVLMGAGIPRQIPGVLDAFASGAIAQLKVDVEGAAAGEVFNSELDPKRVSPRFGQPLRRPTFLAIVSSATLAITLAKKSNGVVNGFVIEGDVAGGHNAPPRGGMNLNADGEPIYGPRDVPELAKFRDLGLPFWLAGAFGHPAKLAEARAAGAAGIQVGTAFAMCEESGIERSLKERLLAAAKAGMARVFTDPAASPTGFPFKVMQVAESLSEAAVYAARKRICDLGLLRTAFKKADGSIGYRCSSEPEKDYVAKGGKVEDTVGRKCLCNALAATVGYAQRRHDGTREAPLVTAGNDLSFLKDLLTPDTTSYSAADVIRRILALA
jgi:nitronate monooxygenase